MFKKVLSWFNKNKESSFKEVVIDSEPKFDEHRAMYFSWNYTCALMCEYPEEDVSKDLISRLKFLVRVIGSRFFHYFSNSI